MLESPSLFTTLIAFLLVLGPLVVIHELGHYLVGRLFGVKADAFAVGFGKELAGWTDRRGTRWKLCALPLGGYVQFAGDMNAASTPGPVDDGLTPAEREQVFQFKPLWQRALIVLAGPMTNLLLAMAVYASFFMAGGKPVAEPNIVGIVSGSKAEEAGFRVGDRVIALDGAPFDLVTDMRDRIILFPGKDITVSVLRNDRKLSLPLELDRREFQDRFGNKGTIGDWGIRFGWPIILGVMPGSPADKAGIRANDRIRTIDGKKIASVEEVSKIVEPKPATLLTVEVQRNGESLTYQVRPASIVRDAPDGTKRRVGLIGVELAEHIPVTSVKVGLIESIALSVDECISTVRMMAAGIGQIFSGERSVKELGGPIKIAKYSGEQFSLGWSAFVSFVALISINLAFINLLPIPALDGGHLAFYAAEAVRRRPLGVRSQEWAIRTGVALVLALMVFVTFNDIASLPIFGG